MTANQPPIPATSQLIMDSLARRYGGNNNTLQRICAEAKKLYEYLHVCGVAAWDEITPELILGWCWAARLDRSGHPRSPAAATARTRQWAAAAVLEVAEEHGWVANGRKLVGARILRKGTGVPIRPLTDREADLVRSYADPGMRYSRRSVMVALSFAGAAAKELSTIRRTALAPDLSRVRLGNRTAPLDDWGRETLAGFFRNRPNLADDALLCLNECIHPARRLPVVNTRLGEALRDAGLNQKQGVTPRSIKLHTALQVFNAHGLEAAARFLGAVSLDKTAQALGYDWKKA